MKIAIASDHAGFELKGNLIASLKTQGTEVVDCGPNSMESVDYPPYAQAVARRVANHTVDRGILICGSGIGMSIVANRFPGVRAALCFHRDIATLCRQHNDANLLVLPGRFIQADDAIAMVQLFLTTPFEAGRHQRRLDLIAAMDCDITHHIPS